MELYLLIALLFIYLITAAMVQKTIVHRIWTLAFISAFALTAAAIGFLRVNQQDVMMSASQLNWYYMLYLFGTMSVALGVINLWMYRKALWTILFHSSDEETDRKSVGRERVSSVV